MSGPAPFVIYGLPRSRTAWLSKFLTYGEWKCGHDELRHARSLADVEGWFTQPCIGTVETLAAPWWRTVRRYAPAARVMVVRRPVLDVVDSLERTGLPLKRPEMIAGMTRLDRKLDQIAARQPGTLTIQYADLAQEKTCARVFEHCLPYQHDTAWWSRLDALNVQIDMQAMLRYWAAFNGQLVSLGKIAKHQTLTELASRPPVAPDGVTFQVEAFDDWLRDVPPLLEDHCVQVGEAPDDYLWKNYPLGRRLYDAGFLQIMTARCNGRMFGYLMTVISQTLEREGKLSATHMPFYASPDIPGLGLKLQRAAMVTLKERGVSEIIMRAGVRGSGPRLGALFRRMGAQPFGQLFKIDMGQEA